MPNWNPDAHLRCAGCGAEHPLSSRACPCDGAFTEVTYAERVPPAGTLSAVTEWLRKHHQPLDQGEEVHLGQGSTPLVPIPAAGPGVMLKDETANPTWSHKDRANATNAAAARMLGSLGMITSTTGNHGASVAAFAAAAGLPAIILCRPGMPDALVKMVWAYGGIPLAAEPGAEQDLIPRFVASGWYPATSLDRGPGGRTTPFGAEAYKRISWELADQLGGAPSAVIVPAASGDTYYGILKGFAELAAYTGITCPKVIAVQPDGANPLQRSAQLGRLTTVPGATSIALSIANDRTGLQALAALQRWDGAVVSVPEAEISRAFTDMAAMGHFLEPASAATLAGYRAARRLGMIAADDVVVLVGTASGAKWLARMDKSLPDGPLASTADLMTELRAREWAGPASS